jgi:hypothetical protein
MKQLKFLTIAAAMFVVVASLSSCFRSDDPVGPESVDISVDPKTYSITVTSTAEATFSIDVPATAVTSADKKSVVFSDIKTFDTTINITATLVNAEGYVTPSQTAQVMFESDGNNDREIAFDFVKLSTETKTQEEVMNATTDVEVSSNPTEYESQLIIPAGTQATGNTTDPYSITCYAPAPRVINLFPKKNNASKTRGDGDDDYGYDDDDISHLGLRLEGIAEPHLNILVVPEASGNSEYHRQDGDNGQQRGVCEGRRFGQHTLGGKEAHGKHQLLHNFQKKEAQRRHVTLRDTPDVLREEL